MTSVEVCSPEHKATIWIHEVPKVTSILELNVREDAVGVTHRKAVFLSKNFDEVLKVQTDLKNADKLMLEGLFYILKLEKSYTAFLGYDFLVNKPRITLHVREY